ncbi:MAG: DUF7674 family protein [Maricaulaceae bacterium]
MSNVSCYGSYIDENCVALFPEMLALYGQKLLSEASKIGSYIFFEDYFNEFIEKHKDDDLLLSRAAAYIESMAKSDDVNVQNLTEIGVLSGLVNREVYGMAKYLKPYSKKLLNKASSHTKVDRNIWFS